MAFHQPFQVIGFHSCDREVGLRMLNGNDHLRPSGNPWDWLGPGIYFWEDNPHHALDYAIDCARKKQKFSGDIKNPLVLGAIIELGNCLNLIEPNSINIVKRAYTLLKNALKVSGEQMPSNKGDNRSRDCAVIKHLHRTNVRYGLPAYDSIRSPFNEGEAIYDQARFTERQHIQICVINPNKITGYFLPRPVEKFNPYLHKDFTFPRR